MYCLWILLVTLLAGGCLRAWAETPGDMVPAGAEVRLGMSAPFSGQSMALGISMRSGAEVYFNKLNAAGGIYGRKINLISYDDGYEPGQTIRNTRKLLEDEKVFLLFGYVGTPTSRVAVPIAVRAQVPYVAPFTGAEFLRDPPLHGVVNVRAGYFAEMEKLVSYITETLGYTRIGLLAQDDSYGSAGHAGLQHALEKRHLAAVAVGKYRRNTTDVDDALAILQAANPQAIVMVGSYAPCAEFIKRARRKGFTPTFLTISFTGTNALVDAVGLDGEGLVISQVMPSPTGSALPVVQAYRADMAAAGQTEGVGYASLEGYVSAAVLAEMLRKAGPSLTRQGLLQAVDDMGRFTLGGLQLHYSSTLRQGMEDVYLTRLKGGKVVEFTPSPTALANPSSPPAEADHAGFSVAP